MTAAIVAMGAYIKSHSSACLRTWCAKAAAGASIRDSVVSDSFLGLGINVVFPRNLSHSGCASGFAWRRRQHRQRKGIGGLPTPVEWRVVVRCAAACFQSVAVGSVRGSGNAL